MLGRLGDSISSRIKTDGLTVEEFLVTENIADLVKRNNKDVISFVVDNIDQILEIAIFKINPSTSLPSVLSQKSMKIITSNNSAILCAISDGNEILAIARKIIHEYTNQNNAENTINWECATSRFSTIIETCLIKYPDSINNFYFLPKFLRFCGNPMLVSLFENIVSSNKDDVKTYLRMIKFPDKIMDIITNWHNADSFDFDNLITLDCILSMYSLLIKYLEKLVDDEITLSPRIIQFSLDFLSTYDRRILAKQWKLAKTVLDQSNSNDFATLYEDAFIAINQDAAVNVDLDLFVEMSHSKSKTFPFQEYQANAIEFLSALLLYNHEFALKIDCSLLINKIVDIFRSNPYNSIALSAVCSFFLVAVDISAMQPYIIDLFLPCIVDVFKEEDDDPNFSKKSVVCRAFSYEFCREMLSIASIDEDLNNLLMEQKEFVSICLPIIQNMEDTISKTYGGVCYIPASVKPYIIPTPLRPVVL